MAMLSMDEDDDGHHNDQDLLLQVSCPEALSWLQPLATIFSITATLPPPPTNRPTTTAATTTATYRDGIQNI